MNMCDSTLQLYEQRIKGLETLLAGRMQLWLFSEEWWTVPSFSRFPVWPENYELVAALDTDSLDEAFAWSNAWDNWGEESGPFTFVYPFGPVLEPTGHDVTVYAPRSSSVGDVLVKPDGSVHMIRPVGFIEILI